MPVLLGHTLGQPQQLPNTRCSYHRPSPGVGMTCSGGLPLTALLSAVPPDMTTCVSALGMHAERSSHQAAWSSTVKLRVSMHREHRSTGIPRDLRSAEMCMHAGPHQRAAAWPPRREAATRAPHL